MSPAPAVQHSESTAQRRPAWRAGKAAAPSGRMGSPAEGERRPSLNAEQDQAGPPNTREHRGRKHAPGPDSATITELARSFIAAHIARPLTCADLVAATGVSERDLRAALLEQAGLGPVGFVLMVRLDQARVWLSTNRESRNQAQIAAALGFRSSAVFGRAYSRRFGETMTQTRKRAVKVGEHLSLPHSIRADCE